jgi:chemotaxis signal transduction protein
VTDESAPARHFDWATAYARIAEAQDRLAAVENPMPAEVQRILRQRAAALAAPPAEAAAAEILDLIVFRLGAQSYAVDAGQALEAIAILRTTPLPGLPPFYLGLTYHRGALYPLLDIRPMLGIAPGDGAVPSHAVLLAGGGNTAAVAADAIEGLQQMPAGALAPAATEAERHPIVRGIAPGAVLVVDAGRLLQDARLTVNQHAIITNNRETGNHEPE